MIHYLVGRLGEGLEASLDQYAAVLQAHAEQQA